MNSQSIALLATFAALAIILNTIRIPAFYLPGWFYTLCEIPVIVSFLLFGFKIGILVEVIHILGQELIFPIGPGGMVIYPMGILVVPLMVFGIYFARKFMIHRRSLPNQNDEKKTAIYVTGFATFFRGGVMPIVDFFVLYQFLLPLALGRVIPVEYALGLVPGFIIYNVTSTFYAVPVAYFIAKQVSKHLRLEARLL